MKKIKFTLFSLRDLLVAFGPMLLVLVIIIGAAYYLVDPAPDRVIEISTGSVDSSYQRFAKQYAAELAKNKVTLHINPSQGSQENLQKISDPESAIQVGFVRSGSADPQTGEDKGLVSLGSLFYEPIWIFYRSKKEFNTISEFKGKRINLGAEGNGMHRMFSQILSVNNMQEADVQIQRLDDAEATKAFLNNKMDALVFSSASDSPLVQQLLLTPDVRLFDFVQSEAYTRRFPFLSSVVLPRGIVDIGRDIPSRDYHLISPTATLVAHESLHPALIGLLLQAAHKIHGKADWFSDQGEFPSDKYTEIPVATEAQKFYKNGPPMLQRYMSFWIANFFDRMWVVLITAGALLLPLSKIIPPLYVWRIRSRIYRWYGQLRIVEQIIDASDTNSPAQRLHKQLQLLDDIEEKVNNTSLPLSYMEELYHLRSHIHFVRDRLQERLRAAEAA
ncbi:TAXI family TRAP transporter solute-binding subunit [Undibacterium sp. SXout20W]|uniref:TAXI family TRAP transporter solute-binding subunit n=1 Tax=Undibacterium sp. SXout20W TaxID=3413051 RepID=UPI003BEFD2F1